MTEAGESQAVENTLSRGDKAYWKPTTRKERKKKQHQRETEARNAVLAQRLLGLRVGVFPHQPSSLSSQFIHPTVDPSSCLFCSCCSRCANPPRSGRYLIKIELGLELLSADVCMQGQSVNCAARMCVSPFPPLRMCPWHPLGLSMLAPSLRNRQTGEIQTDWRGSKREEENGTKRVMIVIATSFLRKTPTHCQILLVRLEFRSCRRLPVRNFLRGKIGFPVSAHPRRFPGPCPVPGAAPSIPRGSPSSEKASVLRSFAVWIFSLRRGAKKRP